MTKDEKISLLNRTFIPAIDDFNKAILYCVNEGLGTQALILTFSAIHLAGWLDCVAIKAGRREFKGWVEKYMLPDSGLDCTASEIYAARCGAIHTYAPESDLSRQDDTVRQLYVAWGEDQAKWMQGHIETQGKGHEILAITGEELVKAYRTGLSRFRKEIETNLDCLTRVHTKATKIFKTMSPEDREKLECGQKALWAALLS